MTEPDFPSSITSFTEPHPTPTISLPINPGQRDSLGIRNGYQGNFIKLFIEGQQVGQVEAAMQRGHVGDGMPARQRKMQIVDMEMNDVEGSRFAENLLQQQNMMHQ